MSKEFESDEVEVSLVFFLRANVYLIFERWCFVHRYSPHILLVDFPPNSCAAGEHQESGRQDDHVALPGANHGGKVPGYAGLHGGDRSCGESS